MHEDTGVRRRLHTAGGRGGGWHVPLHLGEHQLLLESLFLGLETGVLLRQHFHVVPRHPVLGLHYFVLLVL